MEIGTVYFAIDFLECW